MPETPQQTAALLVLLAQQDQAREQVTSNYVAWLARFMRAFTGWYRPTAVSAFARSAAAQSLQAQRAAAAQAAEFQRMSLAVLDIAPGTRAASYVPPQGLRLADPLEVWERPAETYRWARSQGFSETEALAEATSRATTMATTDVALGAREGDRTALLAAGPDVIGYRRVLRPELSRTGVCGLCVVASDRRYYVEDLKPIHNNCVPGWIQVRASGVVSATRRRYAGEFVVLVTAAGKKLTITPEHPVLTDQGWIPARLIREGQNIVGDGGGHRVVGRGPDEDQAPTTAEDFWRAATVDLGLRPRSVPVAPEDFHGDGTDGEVDVVSPDRDLPDVGSVTFAKPLGEAGFVSRHGLGVFLASSGGAIHRHATGRPSPLSGVRTGDDLSSLGDSRPDVPLVPGKGAIARLNLSLSEDSVEHSAFDAVPLGEGENGGPGRVGRDYLVDGEVVLADAPRFDPPRPEGARYDRGAYAGLGLDLIEALAGDVELDRVVQAGRISGSHYVYNLHTVQGWYSAGSLIVSNCKCATLPMTAENDPGSSLNREDLDKLYEAAGSTNGRDLKRVTVTTIDHGELGPMLVSQRAAEKASMAPSARKDVAPKDPSVVIAALEKAAARMEANIAAGDKALEPALARTRERLDALRS